MHDKYKYSQKLYKFFLQDEMLTLILEDESPDWFTTLSDSVSTSEFMVILQYLQSSYKCVTYKRVHTDLLH